MKRFVVLLFVVSSISAGNVIYEDCGSAYELDTVNIAGCERSVPCYLTIGSATNVTITYTPGFVSHNLSQTATVTLNNVQRDTPVSPRACEATWCPVQSHTPAVYRARLELPTNLALNTRGTLRWNILNEYNTSLVCFTVTIQTRNSLEDFWKIISANIVN